MHVPFVLSYFVPDRPTHRGTDISDGIVAHASTTLIWFPSPRHQIIAAVDLDVAFERNSQFCQRPAQVGNPRFGRMDQRNGDVQSDRRRFVLDEAVESGKS
jgi:hypothetical protein